MNYLSYVYSDWHIIWLHMSSSNWFMDLSHWNYSMKEIMILQNEYTLPILYHLTEMFVQISKILHDDCPSVILMN